jgi:hypothetical protein
VALTASPIRCEYLTDIYFMAFLRLCQLGTTRCADRIDLRPVAGTRPRRVTSRERLDSDIDRAASVSTCCDRCSGVTVGQSRRCCWSGRHRPSHGHGPCRGHLTGHRSPNPHISPDWAALCRLRLSAIQIANPAGTARKWRIEQFKSLALLLRRVLSEKPKRGSPRIATATS